MSLLPRPDSLNPNYEECLRLHHCWGWFLGLGIVMMIVGGLAIGAACIATLATVLLFGWLLVVGGVVQVVNAFLARCWRGFAAHLLVGLLQLIVGGIMVSEPLRAAAALTLILAVCFMVGGLLRIAVAVLERFADWGWVLLNGLITWILGIAIWREWPESSLWVIGLFVGIDLLFNGWSWVMLGLMVKSLTAAPPAESRDKPATPAGVH
jgi:uncharacterized membrane protein HdeD (DUF308 family)